MKGLKYVAVMLGGSVKSISQNYIHNFINYEFKDTRLMLGFVVFKPRLNYHFLFFLVYEPYGIAYGCTFSLTPKCMRVRSNFKIYYKKYVAWVYEKDCFLRWVVHQGGVYGWCSEWSLQCLFTHYKELSIEKSLININF